MAAFGNKVADHPEISRYRISLLTLFFVLFNQKKNVFMYLNKKCDFDIKVDIFNLHPTHCNLCC